MLSRTTPDPPSGNVETPSELDPRDVAPGASERERLRALSDYDVLDTPPELAFDRLAAAAADICDAPMALVSLVDCDRQWFKANVGVPLTETSRQVAFCNVAIEHAQLLEVRDACLDPRFAANPLVTGSLGLRYYAGAPLVTPAGYRVGTLCVLDTTARPQGLSEQQRRILAALADQVVTELEMRATLRTMAEQQLELEERERQLGEHVAAQRAMTEAFRHSAAQYRQLFRLTRIRFWTADADGYLTGVNGRAFAAVPGALLRRRKVRLDRRVHPQDRARIDDAWAAALSSGDGLDCDVRQRQARGGYRWTRLRVVCDAQAGAAARWYGTSEDVHELRSAIEAMNESERRFGRLADELPLTLWMTDLSGAITYLSPHWTQFTGVTDVMQDRERWLALIHPDDRHAFDRVLATAKPLGESYDFDFRLRHADGSWRWMMNSAWPRLSESGALLGHIGSLTEVTDRKVAEQALETLRWRVARALDSSRVSVWEWDAASGVVSWLSGSDARLNDVAGWLPSGGKEWLTRVHPADRAELAALFTAYLRGGNEAFECEMRIADAATDGGWRWILLRGASIARDAAGQPLKLSGTLSDIDRRKRVEECLQWTVGHDSLTDLPNRVLLQQRLNAALAAATAQAGPYRIALALLDLDHFKQVNDVYGHGAGDALLKEVARRLQAFLRSGETAARLGGDEFTLLIPDCGSDAAIEDRVSGLVAALRRPFAFEGIKLDCRASVGVSCYPEHASDAASLLKNADIAMYRAKASGRGGITIYQPALGAELLERTQILDKVRAAIDDGHLVPFYQAQLSLESGQIIGFEALLRLRDVRGGFGLPTAIEDAFQDSELGVAIGACVLDQVVADLARWQQAGVPIGYVAVNVSAAELRRTDYAERVLATLAAAGVAPKSLHIEVTETVFLGRDSRHVENALQALSAAGVRIALDDFGTGFASLSHLKRFPIDIIKIDRSFVRDLETEFDDSAIVDAVIGLARGLGMTVIAEGVETAGQAKLLLAKGCDLVQGFFYHRPCHAAGVQAVILAAGGDVPRLNWRDQGGRSADPSRRLAH